MDRVSPSPSGAPDDIAIERSVSGVMEAERRRGRALEQNDIATLRALISPDITHTHTRGVTDDFDSYLRYIQEELEFLACDRGELLVRLFGDVAVMTGPMHNIVRKRGTEARIAANALTQQVWEWRRDRWMMVAFQSTSLPKEN